MVNKRPTRDHKQFSTRKELSLLESQAVPQLWHHLQKEL